MDTHSDSKLKRFRALFSRRANTPNPSSGPKVERFRALVIGRANAGKTTILKAICGSEIDPRVSARNVLKLTANLFPQVIPSTDVGSGYLLHLVLLIPYHIAWRTRH
jgi:GTPase SAR1 family protein